MSQIAALLVVSQDLADRVNTKAASSYYLGMRDAFEAVFRACHGVPDDQDAMSTASHVLASMNEDERTQLVQKCRTTLRSRRTTTVAETVSAV